MTFVKSTGFPNFLVYSSIDRHGWFPILDIVKNALVDMSVDFSSIL